MIKLDCRDREQSIKLDFGSAFEDRDQVRDVLSKRLTPEGAANAAAQAAASSGVASGGAAGAAPNDAKKGDVERQEVVIDWKSLSPKDREWRERLLGKNEVLQLHVRLVLSGIVKDETFWKGMKCKYRQDGQRRGTTAAEVELDNVGTARGVPSSAFGRPIECDEESGELKWGREGFPPTPSPSERHRIFMEHPPVALAYRAKVLDAARGARMSDLAFWNVYKQSSMAQKHVKGTKRAAAIATEADAMFAEFHASQADVLEREERARSATVDVSLNLSRFDDHRQAHVLEGHATGGDAPHALKKRKKRQISAAEESHGLDLMRKLNAHGSMVMGGVDSAQHGSWREDANEKSHPLPDLEDRPAVGYAKLQIESEDAFYGVIGGSGTRSDAQGAGLQDGRMQGIAAAVSEEFVSRGIAIGRLSVPVEGSGAVLQEVFARLGA